MMHMDKIVLQGQFSRHKRSNKFGFSSKQCCTKRLNKQVAISFQFVLL